ncbi:hypothetical protein AOLI_G00141770 [Acnodon oligacanthus]
MSNIMVRLPGSHFTLRQDGFEEEQDIYRGPVCKRLNAIPDHLDAPDKHAHSTSSRKGFACLFSGRSVCVTPGESGLGESFRARSGHQPVSERRKAAPWSSETASVKHQAGSQGSLAGRDSGLNSSCRRLDARKAAGSGLLVCGERASGRGYIRASQAGATGRRRAKFSKLRTDSAAHGGFARSNERSR